MDYKWNITIALSRNFLATAYDSYVHQLWQGLKYLPASLSPAKIELSLLSSAKGRGFPCQSLPACDSLRIISRI